MEDDSLYGTEKDGSKSNDYCGYCYENGEFVKPNETMEECKKKKPDVDVSKARFTSFTEGLCVQMMHIGPYDKEYESIELMGKFISKNSLTNITDDVHKHHEIYLSDPRKTSREKLRTILRFLVRLDKKHL